MPDISVIIPCYNSGAYLPEAIESVEQYKGKFSCEIIIVDDGSTDDSTLNLLQQLSDKGYHIIHQSNAGPASARNTGVRASKGEYLLFLDSDNKIRNQFIDKAIHILQKQSNVGVVYGNAHFFYEVSETISSFQTGVFDLKKILFKNYIDMCSIMRKEVWLTVGPFDEDRIMIGHEDWDYWIRTGSSRWQLHYVNEVVFDYRIRQNSLIKEASAENKHKAMKAYLYTKHLELLMKNYEDLYEANKFYQRDKNKPLRSFVKYLYYKYAKKNNHLLFLLITKLM